MITCRQDYYMLTCYIFVTNYKYFVHVHLNIHSDQITSKSNFTIPFACLKSFFPHPTKTNHVPCGN